MKRGFKDISGADISQSMIDLALDKKCYNIIKKADLLKPLPFEDNHFDLLVTAGVTTYLGECLVLKESTQQQVKFKMVYVMA